MARVHVLDDNTINKIAAGEVVERPASVIKELVENAIDAKAKRIEVEIMAGGTAFMRVTDDGIGMSCEDAKLAILRHATSKLKEVSDLLTIGTLGFRGEALPSIASVSRFSLVTRQQGSELGTSITIIGGKEPEISETGCGIGTTIKVEDLFFNTPARKKFLKTNNTEAGKISDFITKLAISNPQIAFKFINNNKQVMVTPGNGNLYDTLQSIYGKTAADALLPIDFQSDEGEISVSGYISKPSSIRSNRAWQTFIVNGRIVANRAVTKAVDNAYNALVPKSGFPLVVLLIKLPQRNVDVNVHPQKTEMKFADEQLLFKSVYKGVLDAIRPVGQNLTDVAAEVEKPRPQYSYQTLELPIKEPSPKVNSYKTDNHSFVTKSPEIGFSHKEQWSKADVIKEPKREEVTEKAESVNIAESANNIEPVNNAEKTEIVIPQSSMIPIGQIDKTYIIAKDDEGMYIVDQHAAHERILFDKYSAQAEKIPSQQLLIHQYLDFDSHESHLVEKNTELFTSLGFHMEPSGKNQFRLMEVPADIEMGEAEDIIREILMSLQEMHSVGAAELRQHCLATTACKAAIKAGMELNLRQMQVLLDELNATAMPYTCPHGRPTILKFTNYELAKMFKRTGF